MRALENGNLIDTAELAVKRESNCPISYNFFRLITSVIKFSVSLTQLCITKLIVVFALAFHVINQTRIISGFATTGLDAIMHVVNLHQMLACSRLFFRFDAT